MHFYDRMNSRNKGGKNGEVVYLRNVTDVAARGKEGNCTNSTEVLG